MVGIAPGTPLRYGMEKLSIRLRLARLAISSAPNPEPRSATSSPDPPFVRSAGPSPEPRSTSTSPDPPFRRSAAPSPESRSTSTSPDPPLRRSAAPSPEPSPEDIGLSAASTNSSSTGQRGATMSSAQVNSDEDERVHHELNDEDEGGLFGDGDEDNLSGVESTSSKHRKLSDEELDTGDDEDRIDRVETTVEKAAKEPELANILAASIGRHAGPQPSDNELYLLSLPNSIGIEPKNFTLGSFQPPQTDHHSSGPPSATFSAFQTSTNTIRWRYSPSDPHKIQSNARILRWSDGSLTLQLATNSCEQLELVAKPLAQPQINPKKPTPTSTTSRTQGSALYDPRLDSHTYLMAPHESAELMRTTNRITTSLAIQSSSDQDDEALTRLQQSLAAAQKGNKGTADGGLTVININEDPELAKKRAEVAEKEKSKMARRMQVMQEREVTRSNNVLKRSGLRTGGISGGLTIGGLEDDDGMTTTRGRMSKPKSRRPRRRNSEYSDDEEDFRGRGRTREDEYDEEDGFLVGSDEEVEIGEESEEEAEMGDEGDEEEPAKKSKKRESEEVASGVRNKRRRVIDDEEED